MHLQVPRFINKKSSLLLDLAVIFLSIACIIATLNMLLRPIGLPIFASYEIISFCLAISIALSLPDSFIKGNHICVDILLKRFNRKIENVFTKIGKFTILIFFLLIVYKLVIVTTQSVKTKELSEGLKIPLYIPKLFVLVGFIAFTLTLISLILIPPKK